MTTTVAAPTEQIPVSPGSEVAGESPSPERRGLFRLAVVAACPVVAAAVMSGGLFLGAGARVWAVMAGLAGVGVAAWAARIRNTALLYVAIIGGVFGVGVAGVVPAGLSSVFDIGSEIREAVTSGEVLRPPVDFLPGWRALLGWIMASVGFVAGWLALALRRPAASILAALPVIGIGAISLPTSEQLAGGLVALVLLVVALAILSGATDDDQRSVGYEVRRAIRALPLVAAVTVGLYFASSSTFLFPPPLYDPAQDARLPKTIPLSEVEDRVLFTVDARFSGPWKMGSLDVYDGRDWRLPPFAESELREVPESGIVNDDLKPAVRATFTVQGLGGAILPGLANTVGIQARGPTLTYDVRTGNIRLAQGQFELGFSYTVVSASVPTIELLQRSRAPLPDDVKRFTDIGAPPPAVAALLGRAPTENSWDRLDFLRQNLLTTVIATGQGVPKSVEPERVQDMLAGTREGTPYEIVAAQAMLARWAGIPSRIGYGFDGGDAGVGGLLEVRPKHGALFLEVFFPGYGWLPIIGDPLQAKEAVSDAPQQTSEGVQVSSDVAVRLFIPVLTEQAPSVVDEVRNFLARTLPILSGLLVVALAWPLPYKALRRARRRTWAGENGPVARIAQAYAEWRDHATDFGYQHKNDTPLMFLEAVSPDEEHTELAWLVTRTLWGDLREEVGPDDALAAEELAKSLRNRLSRSQPVSMRVVSAFSRLSIRHSYAQAIDLAMREEGRVHAQA